jgi:quinol monooxygenase YgiN
MNNPLYVIVRFEVKEGEAAKLTSLIKHFFEKEVSSFSGFISFKLHSNQDGTVIINYATWESIEYFQKFVAFASTSEISKQIQAYHPQSDRVYEIVI